METNLPFSKAMTRKQLAKKMGISYSSLYRLIKKHKLNVSNGLLTPNDVSVIMKAANWYPSEEDQASLAQLIINNRFDNA